MRKSICFKAYKLELTWEVIFPIPFPFWDFFPLRSQSLNDLMTPYRWMWRWKQGTNWKFPCRIPCQFNRTLHCSHGKLVKLNETSNARFECLFQSDINKSPLRKWQIQFWYQSKLNIYRMRMEMRPTLSKLLQFMWAHWIWWMLQCSQKEEQRIIENSIVLTD